MLKYATVEKPNGNVRQVYKTASGGFTTNPKISAGKRFNLSQRRQLKGWAARKDFKLRITKSKYVFLIPNKGVSMPIGKAGNALNRKLNNSAREAKRYMKIVSGRRTPYEAWKLRNGYLRGWSGYNLAARCCTKYWGTHSWWACGKNPTSHHARNGGMAVDGGWITSKGGYLSFRDWNYGYAIMRKNGLKATVPSEAWHISVVTGPYSVYL